MKSLDTIYLIYIKWLAVPSADRKPPSLSDFLTTHEVSPIDLMSFQERETFGTDLLQETIKWAKRKTPEMLHTLYSRYLETKNPADLNAWLDAIRDEEKRDKNRPNQNIINIFNPTDEQRRQIVERLSRRAGLPGAGGQE